MGKSPSSRRREGREAFFPQGNPKDFCPYHNQYDRSDWFDGWEEAQIAYSAQEYKEQREDERFEMFSNLCPWQSYEEKCLGTYDSKDNSYKDCNRSNCAPLYFREEW